MNAAEHAAFAAAHPTVAELLSKLRDRGVRAVASGRLTAPADGHPAGVHWLLIEARTLDACELAELWLADLGGRPDDAWEHGWHEGTDRRWPLQLMLYPQPPEPQNTTPRNCEQRWRSRGQPLALG